MNPQQPRKGNTVWTVAGNGIKGYFGDDGLATEAQLNSPYGVAVHPKTGDLYIADYNNHRIRKVAASDNKITTIGGTGVCGYSGDGGLAIHAQLNSPIAIAIHEKNDEVYFADYLNHRIGKISLRYGTISTVAGNSTCGTSGDGGLALFAQLYYPHSVKIHPITNDIYIVDFFNHKIRRISHSDGIISTVAGNGTSGFYGDGGFATNARLNSPSGLDFNPISGDIFIADMANHRIRKIDFKTGIISTLAGTGSSSFSGDGFNVNLYFPYDISYCQMSGKLCFIDRNNQRIRTVSPIDSKVTTICGNGEKGFSGDGGLAINASISSPTQISVHPKNGNIYFTDISHSRIRTIIGAFNGPELSPIHFKLKKYDRDIVEGSTLICHRSLLDILAPHFSKSVVFNPTLLKFLDSQQMEIIQHLIDSIMYQQYHDSQWNEKYESIDILAVLGMSNDFCDLKGKLVDEFSKSFVSNEACAKILEKITQVRDSAPLSVENTLLDQIMDYSIGQAAEIMKKSASAVDIPIFQKYLTLIAKKLSSHTNPIFISDEASSDNIKSAELLFNDKSTSDVTVKIGTNEYHVHKTILASNSSYYEALFNSGFEYQDLKDNVYVIDTQDFDEFLHETVLKYCYGVFDIFSAPIQEAFQLLKCFAFYDIKEMTDYYLNNLQISVDNYCTLFEMTSLNDSLYEKLITFGVDNIQHLFSKREILIQLSSEVKDEICFRKFSSSQ